MKTCLNCLLTKPLDCFGTRNSNPDGKRTWCKECESKAAKERRKKELAENPDKRKFLDRVSNLKRMFGMSIEEYDKKLAQQNGVCAICGGTCVSGKRLAVDHNHTTGKIRDLLCGNCNGGLGKFKENPDIMLKAIEYLRKHNG